MDDKNKYIDNMARTALAQGAGVAVSKGFASLMIAVGFPEAAVLTPFVRGATIGLMNTLYDDVTKRTLSERENEKVDLLAKTSLQTFMELAKKDGVTAITMQIDEGQLLYAYEVSEDLMLTAIRQSQQKKVEILGRYYGGSFYKGNIDWQDMHQIIIMAGTLTFRQIVLIRLICEGFGGISPELFITKPSACVEINRMQDYGLWMTDMAMFKDDSSAKIQIKLLKPTEYAKMVCDALMLEKLSDEDIKRTIDSLLISDEGEPAEGITKEDYEAATMWHYDEKEEGLIAGSQPEDVAVMLKGKDYMKDASQYFMSDKEMMAIDCVMNALGRFKQCKSEALVKESIDDALKDLADYFEHCRDHGGLRILNGKRTEYMDVLNGLKSDYLQKNIDYLSATEEKDEVFDEDYANKQSEKMVEEIFSKAEEKNKGD